MRTFILVAFWIYVVTFIITVFQMALSEYPRIEPPRGLGYDAAKCFIALAFGLWAAFVLWMG